MASKEASLKVTIKNQSFLAGMRQIVRKTVSSGQEMGAALTKSLKEPIKAGISSAKKSLQELGSGIKDTMKSVGTLGGAIGGASLVANALELQGLYGQVAFEMERATGKSYSVAQAQAVIASAANKTKRTHEEMATAMKTMLDRGADPTFAIASMESVGHVMNVTGQDAERLGRLMAGVSSKYGLSGKEGAAMLDRIVGTASRGKLQMEEFFEDFNEFGSLAKGAGLEGSQGLNTMLSMIEQMGPKLNGTTSEVSAGLEILFERLRDAGTMERIFKEAGATAGKMKFNRDQFSSLNIAVDQAEYLTRAGPKAMKAFRAEFTGREEKAAFDAMFKPYFDKLNSELKAGTKEATAHQKAVEEMRDHQKKLGDPMANQGKVLSQSARAQQTATAKMRDAMNKLSEAMTKPEMLDAINSFSENLPKLASVVASALGFIAKNPMLAMGAYAGARVGLSFASGALMSAGAKIGTAAATAIRTKAAAVGAWGVAGRAMGVAAGAAIAYYMGQQAIKNMYEQRDKELGGAVVGEARAAAVAGSKNLTAKEAELKSVQAQIAELKANQSSWGGWASNTANQTFGAIAGGLGMTDGYTDTRADSLAKLEAAERQLEASITKQKEGANLAADGSKELAASAKEAAKATREVAAAMKGLGGLHTGPGHAQGG